MNNSNTTDSTITTVSCPTCQKQVQWLSSSQFKPFCSNRCKLIDLGEWASEEHKISTPLSTTDKMSEMDLDKLEDMLLENENESFFK
ncbi:DNA gyrase inhibitor YacG [Flocculibacter collagenilyticus]|uniref:DNA gyrase inhibitor YacG n=1 Tax=Flocculibacter collagenilyticus TaxID=2744479 RepID=UPI0018F7902F|nr:DNA gyrase inhibitor YacG [Flocculibacter collagenilyticus]